MTSMSNPGFGQYPGDPGEYVQQRTSVMAILSLVLSLICLIPGLSILAAIFAIAALVAISRSGERLTGRGLAIAGLILSLLVSAVWIGGGIGAVQFWKVVKAEMIQPAAQTMQAVEASDYAQVRAVLNPASAKAVTDADIDAFRHDYQAELGKFESIPATPMQLWMGLGDVAQQFQSVSGRGDVKPLPAKFEKGVALLVFQSDSNSAKIMGVTSNVMIMAPNGSKWTLYDPNRGNPHPAKNPPDAKTPEKPGAAPEAPKPAEAPNPTDAKKDPAKPG